MKGASPKMNSESVQEQIHHYIRDELGDGITFDRDANLIRQGVIDSMGVMKLIVFLEKRFGIEIKLEEITAENFETLNHISRLVENSREKRPSPPPSRSSSAAPSTSKTVRPDSTGPAICLREDLWTPSD